jgi:surface protein
MSSLKARLKKRRTEVQSKNLSVRTVFKNETGAIDLASIMVGIIVIGLIGGVIAATIFTVIPWAQDNAAKHQLDSIASAESAYMGLSSADPSPLPAGYVPNSFGNSAQLAAGKLLNTGTTYCAVTPADGKSYTGYSKSASGKVWFITDKNTKPAILTDPVPVSCGFAADGTTPAVPAPYVDPSPTLTSLTYKCNTTTSGTLPWQNSLNGKETWDDGTPAKIYTNTAGNASKTLLAGQTYKVTFDGTYKNFTSAGTGIAHCLISMDHWGSNTGVTDATNAFFSASKLVSVPDHIPSTITTTYRMFQDATIFNDPKVSKWDVSNVIVMNQMFYNATSFNQSLNSWNVSNVVNMSSMFASASTSNFNQDISSWNTAKVANMSFMFNNASSFNQNIKSWNVSKVTSSTNFRTGSALTAANSPF